MSLANILADCILAKRQLIGIYPQEVMRRRDVSVPVFALSFKNIKDSIYGILLELLISVKL